MGGSSLPRDVKNWSDREEVSEAFTKKYASGYINLNAVKSDKSSKDASAQLSDSRSDGSLPSASAPVVSLAASDQPVEAHAATVALRDADEADDAHVAVEMASVSTQGAQTTSHASITIAATLLVVGIAFMRSVR